MDFEIIVVGAGHAGCEAALAASRLGAKTALITLRKDTIGLMSCNPAIGGVGKGQLVKEIDALGGQMAKAADACGIQFRILNASKGPAVHSTRAQIDMRRYQRFMADCVFSQENLTLIEDEVEKVLVDNFQVQGIKTRNKEIFAHCVVIAPGTFLEGLIHQGLKNHPGGRIDEPAIHALAWHFRELGFKLLRFKTGTCPRLDKNTIDFSRLKKQSGDNPLPQFSFFGPSPSLPQLDCHLAYTNQSTHKIIRDNLDQSPLFSGIIQGTGVRYCPSIEDKVVKFAEKTRHQIFLEPEGLDVAEIYPNGLSTSLPEEVQLKIVHSIDGLQEAKVLRFGYGIEHTVVEPTQLYPSLETKLIKNLFFAGQINGTTGYEEAAAQGLVAGINAFLRLQKKEPLVLSRSSSYIGVLLDDLTTKGTNEPYRMFTSRVEYRLVIREDNADIRLAGVGYGLGLLGKNDYEKVKEKTRIIKETLGFLKKTRIKAQASLNEYLQRINSSPVKTSVSLEELLKRPQVSLKDLIKELGLTCLDLPEKYFQPIEIELKYAGFIQRQMKEVEQFEHLEKIRLPEELDYQAIQALSREIREKLAKFKPLNLGQAARISGITPAAISMLMIYLKKFYAGRKLS